MAETRSGDGLTELEFLKLLRVILPEILQAEVVSEPLLMERYRQDFIVRFPSGKHGIVEAKAATPNTRTRLMAVANQLILYSARMSRTIRVKGAQS